MLSAHKSSSFSVQKNISSHRRKLWFCVVLTYSLALCMKLFNCRLCHETHTSFLLCQNEHAYRRTINVLQANIITFFLLHCNPSDSRTTGKIQLWLWLLTIMVSLPRGSPVDPMSVKGLLTPPEEIRLFSSFPLLQMKAVKQMWYQKNVFVVWSV